MHNVKNSASIIGAAVYIVVSGKWTNFCIYGRTLAKIHIASKKGSNKRCSELNFVQKSLGTYMSIPLPRSEARGHKRYPPLKYYNVEKWKNRFTLRLDAAENTHHIKKGSNECCSELNFVQKSPWAHMSNSLRVELRGWAVDRYPYYNWEKWKSRFTLRLDAAENMYCIKKKVQINVVQNWILYEDVLSACVYLPQEWS